MDAKLHLFTIHPKESKAENKGPIKDIKSRLTQREAPQKMMLLVTTDRDKGGAYDFQLHPEKAVCHFLAHGEWQTALPPLLKDKNHSGIKGFSFLFDHLLALLKRIVEPPKPTAGSSRGKNKRPTSKSAEVSFQFKGGVTVIHYQQEDRQTHT